ncbi:hypothetical protein D1007_21645 [Hordeum vulgare]|nr:hypothetical protein D1007_21645 [Hordeum vulgare]
MDSVKNYVTGEAILERNLRLLLTWYYKKFRVRQLDSSISYESRLRQLIQNWSEEKAKKVDNIIQNNYLGVGEYVEDLMMPFIPAQDGTLAKPKTDARIKVLARRVLTDLQEVASLVWDAGVEQVDRMYTLAKKMDEYLRRVENIHLSDLGAPSHPMEASVENAQQAFDQGKQKDVTEVAAKYHCKQGIKNDDMDPPMKNLDEDFDVVDAAIQIMRHDEPIDTRDGQFVYIERVAVVAKLERDGRIEKCYEDALAGIAGTTQGTNYLKHDMVFLPTRSLYVHWFLVVVNPRRKEIQVRGMEAHLRAAMRINGIEINALEDINVTQWLVRDIIVSKGNESALYMLKNIELFTGEKLRMQYDQAYINKFRRELHVVLVGSRYNKIKYKKRFKQYHARLSDAAAVEDDEDARS